ncbi:hypothetical protein MD484_g5853, partial [Candolleomyces efflorescens]
MTVMETFVFDPRPSYPLLITANRYPFSENPGGLTLVFAHGTGFHKEQWEPTIEDLKKLDDTGIIREVWSIEAPNHGDSAILNEEVLRLGYTPIFGWEEYTRAIHLFLSGFGKGLEGVDFSKHKLVGVGHSMGAVSLMLLAGHFPQVKFESLICCDLMCMHERFGGTAKEFLVGGAERRRDTWPSKEEAYKIMKARGTWKTWDERVLRIFVASTAAGRAGIKLKACYRDPLGSSRAYRLLPSFVKETRTHLIYGAIDDYLPAEVKEDILRVVGGVDELGSFSRVAGAGHLIPQQNPQGLAERIYAALPQRQARL